MELVVAVDSNFAIGINGDLLCYIPSDLKHFKNLTSGQVVVMGRKTLESFPNKKPLPNREHIILTRNKDLSFDSEMVTLCYDISNLKSLIEKFKSKKVFVIGGGEIYKQLLPYCQKAHITKIKKEFKADTFFPNLDKMENWQVIDTSDTISENDVEYNFVTYTNNDVLEL